jgi:hypothetical protein
VLAWTTNKLYLRELQQQGVPIVDTLWNPSTLPRDGRDWVIKPAIGAAAEDVTRWSSADLDRGDETLAELASRSGDVLAQPYLPSIERSGESCLVYLGGRWSHAVTKAALLTPGIGPAPPVLAGDPREVITPLNPTTEQLAVAGHALETARNAIGMPQAYARVDLADNDDGSPVVLELELAEPSLYLTHSVGAAARFADVLVG